MVCLCKCVRICMFVRKVCMYVMMCVYVLKWCV